MKKNNSACPDCGGTIHVWFDLNTEVHYEIRSGGRLSRPVIITDNTGEERFGVRCRECGWQIHGQDDEIDHYEEIVSQGGERAEGLKLSIKR